MSIDAPFISNGRFLLRQTSRRRLGEDIRNTPMTVIFDQPTKSSPFLCEEIFTPIEGFTRNAASLDQKPDHLDRFPIKGSMPPQRNPRLIRQLIQSHRGADNTLHFICQVNDSSTACTGGGQNCLRLRGHRRSAIWTSKCTNLNRFFR